VAIFAQGAVGLSATLGAKLRGAGLVVTIEGLANRQEMSRRFGADVVIDPASGNVAEQIIELTDGGADSTVEALGNQVTLEAALYATPPPTSARVGACGWSG
jgi:threonine dehydrogenase-like Zn-dependent dehydrogenase